MHTSDTLGRQSGERADPVPTALPTASLPSWTRDNKSRRAKHRAALGSTLPEANLRATRQLGPAESGAVPTTSPSSDPGSLSLHCPPDGSLWLLPREPFLNSQHSGRVIKSPGKETKNTSASENEIVNE